MPATTAARRTPRRRNAGSGDSDRIDRLGALHATLTEGVAALAADGQWRAMLDAARLFHRYSLRNVLLILAARPDATRVAGFRTWQRLGRSVRKGERGIPILAPCTYKADADRDGDDPGGDDTAAPDGTPPRVLRGFRVVHVFDISQTDGDPIPDVTPVLLDGDDPGRLYDALAAQIDAAGYALRRAPLDGTANGRTDLLTRTVTIRPGLSAAHACKTLAHELAHVLLHGPDDVAGTARERAEVEAESVAFVVCGAAGLDSADYSLPYVAGWAGGDAARVKDSAERVIETARRVLDRLAADTGALADVTAATADEADR